MSASKDRPLIVALLGAVATLVALTGAVAIADTPRQLESIAQTLVSTEVFEIMPAPSGESPPVQALAPAHGDVMGPALQIADDMYA